MAARKHAVLSASSSHRWLSCTPSARLEQEFEWYGKSDSAGLSALHFRRLEGYGHAPVAITHALSSSLLSCGLSSYSTASIIRAPVRKPSIYTSSSDTLVSPALAIAYSASSG